MDIICWYQQFELLISTMLFVDVDNWYCRYEHVHAIIPISTIDFIAFMYYWYRQLELSISLMHNLNNTNCWYQQIIVHIHNSNCRYRQLYRQLIVNVDIDNSNCWYQKLVLLQLELSISTTYVHCWNRQLELSILLIPNVDIDNWYYCFHLLLISTIAIIDIYIVRTLLITTISDNFNCRYQ